MKHREIHAVGIEPQLLARHALGDERAHRERRRHEDQIATRVLLEFTLDQPRIDSRKACSKPREFVAQDFVLIFDVRGAAIAYGQCAVPRLRRSMALQAKAGETMEHVARRDPLRHPTIERLDHRNIQAVPHPVESESVRKHRRRHQPRKRAHFFFRHSVHAPRRIRRVQMLEMTEPLHLPRQVERVKRTSAADADFHEASARSPAAARPGFATPPNSTMRSSAGANTRS